VIARINRSNNPAFTKVIKEVVNYRLYCFESKALTMNISYYLCVVVFNDYKLEPGSGLVYFRRGQVENKIMDIVNRLGNPTLILIDR
jgi:hypothetical protein